MEILFTGFLELLSPDAFRLHAVQPSECGHDSPSWLKRRLPSTNRRFHYPDLALERLRIESILTLNKRAYLWMWHAVRRGWWSGHHCASRFTGVSRPAEES